MSDKKQIQKDEIEPLVVKKIEEYSHEYFLSQYPSPETLERYENINKGSAEQIFDMFDKQQIEEHKENKRGFTLQITGMILGFLFIMSMTGASLYLLNNDKELGGITALFAALTPFLAIFAIKNKA